MKQETDYRTIKAIKTRDGFWVMRADARLSFVDSDFCLRADRINQYYEYGCQRYAVYIGDWMALRVLDVELVWYGDEPSGNQAK